jgi:hypothetical protein
MATSIKDYINNIFSDSPKERSTDKNPRFIAAVRQQELPRSSQCIAQIK